MHGEWERTWMLAAPVPRKVGLDATRIGIYRDSISLD